MSQSRIYPEYFINLTKKIKNKIHTCINYLTQDTNNNECDLLGCQKFV